MPSPLVPDPPNLCTCGHDLLRHTPNCLDCPSGHAFNTPQPTLEFINKLANGAPGTAATSRGG